MVSFFALGKLWKFGGIRDIGKLIQPFSSNFYLQSYICYTDLMTILAFDPGIERTGFAVFDTTSGSDQLIDYGCLFTQKAMTLPLRLDDLHAQVTALCLKHNPTHVAMEQLFFTNNQKTAITVAQAQGVMLLAAANYAPVTFFSPVTIKLAVTGYGKADKKQVEQLIMAQLGLKEAPKPDDTVDAIACGLTAAIHYKLQHNIASALMG
jgi:crossover junction endodeoxyribonuclease RuvC